MASLTTIIEGCSLAVEMPNARVTAITGPGDKGHSVHLENGVSLSTVVYFREVLCEGTGSIKSF